ncbi:GvpL/GvpF family gas vesicle protein [Geodermatophilus ruber]|uniref:Gas vesicle synthesis protein GvpL/GvpF n=1 Tax=Geodermatophilus ruber TaxID=504800 RepID=A0A1I4GRH5_9ACTN|nr:GvpL/GvpF family gas vesicle protein [Geodermatophilus ruber]SFL32073.1 Gas vesicle synthesis protein GvpL/GvpF [Geodermatophilus ruber]
MALHLYGVVRTADLLSGEVPAAPGTENGPPLSAVTRDDLAAVVSPLDPDRELTESDAVRHLDVLTGLVARGPVLPLRFGTTAPDEDAVREEVLGARADDLRRGLSALEGVIEVRLDLTSSDDRDLPPLLTGHPELHDLAARARAPGAGMDEQLQVGEATAQLLSELRARRAEEIAEELAPLVEQTRYLAAPSEEVERWAFLVERDRLDELDTAIAGLRARRGHEVDLGYVGPLPAFSFLDRDERPECATAPASRWGW